MTAILVTGGAGFIGANFVLHAIERSENTVVNLDALTYAGNLDNLRAIQSHPRHIFVHGNISDSCLVERLLIQYHPSAIINFAAESHVDRSIDGPGQFIKTNVVGTYELLESARRYWLGLGGVAKKQFRFLHASTDEVYGSLGETGRFTEITPYAPHSPYAASKAASDFFVRAYHRPYGIPVLTINCSNNYGPSQFPEKLVPVTILKALRGEPIPVYGDGNNIRDWLFVEDHCSAITLVIERGRIGESYNVGGDSERKNIDVVGTICRILDEITPDLKVGSREKLITFVTDRPGHDQRYAIDTTKICSELGWCPRKTFDSGLRKTIVWYLENQWWVDRVLSGSYKLERLGLGNNSCYDSAG